MKHPKLDLIKVNRVINLVDVPVMSREELSAIDRDIQPVVFIGTFSREGIDYYVVNTNSNLYRIKMTS